MTVKKSTAKETAEMETLKEELANLRSDVASLVASLGKISQSKVAEATDSVTETLEENTNWNDMKLQIEQARAQGEQLSQDLGEEVSRHPLASIAIAFGIGYIASKIVK
ncbi:MAG: hypothetical protein U9Q75_10710 [Pseudomonadota bacterium]|nr:hypothetical protein [Pseudomonadota bacterium]